jgi:carbonic anhydrase/acetyltransferase-like protein (isoleucine patch superfamily)
VSAHPPIGADAVVPPRSGALASRLRLARLRLQARGTLEAGPDVHVGRGVRIRTDGGGRVRLGGGCLLAPGSRIEAPGGTVAIGAGARIGERSVIVALSQITVGDGATVGEWAVLSDAEPAGADVEVPIRLQPPAPRPIAVGGGARIGAHAALGAGARIAPGAVVGSYAVVPTEPRSR